MNIEETQKVNRLAKELLAHGIAASSNDAVAKAEEMIRGRSASSHAEKKEEMKEDSSMNNNEIRYIHTNIAQIHADVRRLSAEISAIKGNYENLRSAVASLKEAKRDYEPKESAVSAPKPADLVQSRLETSPAEKKRLPEEDVSIEKIFYFGKK